MVGRRNGASRYLIHGRECHFGWCAVKRINYLTIFVNKPHDLHIYAINYHSAIKMFLFKRRFSILFFFFARYPDIFRSFCFGSCQRLHIVTNAFKTFAACHIVTSPFCQCEGVEEKNFQAINAIALRYPRTRCDMVATSKNSIERIAFVVLLSIFTGEQYN